MENIDWGKTIGLISNIIVGISAAAVAWIAYRGLSTWKNELEGKARFEVVKRLVSLAHRFRSQYHYARGITGSSAESADRPKADNEPADESWVRDRNYARLKRLELVRETLLEMQEAAWEADVLIEDTPDDLVQPFIEKYTMLSLAIDTVFRVQLRKHISDSEEEILDRNERVMYGLQSDELGEEVNRLTDEFCARMKNLVQ